MKKIYIEISDICGLECQFCDTLKGKRGEMDLACFKKAVFEAKKHTKLITLHILGDPLKVKNLHTYLNIAKEARLNVEITTSGIYLNNFDMLIKPPIKQINFSLDAIRELKNAESFLRKIFEFCDFKIQNKSEIFINLRVQKRAENTALVTILENHFKLSNLTQNLFAKSQNRIKLGNKIIIDFRDIFLWSFWDNANKDISITTTDFTNDSSDNITFGTCLALKNHIGILANGEIVPCCIDVYGKLSLGNIAKISIKSALDSTRARKMRSGFDNNIIYEPLCKTCDYRKRFIK